MGKFSLMMMESDANAMDGVIGVTQCAIFPGESFVYNFTISHDQSGTFWYHAHSAVQRADGLYGGLVVHKPVTSQPRTRGLRQREDLADIFTHGYDQEVLFLIGDWYHRSAGEVSAWYLRAGSYGNEVRPSLAGPEDFRMLTAPSAGSRLGAHQRRRSFQLLHGGSGEASGLYWRSSRPPTAVLGREDNVSNPCRQYRVR